jgi:hypothetical protein
MSLGFSTRDGHDGMCAWHKCGLADRAKHLHNAGMKISDARIEELRRLDNEAYGQDISVEEAREMTRRLVESSPDLSFLLISSIRHFANG